MAKRKKKPKRSKVVAQPPFVLAAILFDQLYRDPATAKASFLGAFSTIGVRKFPAVHPRMCLHIELTDGRGKTKFKLQLIDAEEEREPLFVGEGMVQFGDPRMIVELDFELNNITFPGPGEYRFQIFCAGALLMERRLLLAELKRKEEEA